MEQYSKLQIRVSEGENSRGLIEANITENTIKVHDRSLRVCEVSSTIGTLNKQVLCTSYRIYICLLRLLKVNQK